jgi:hypothetical protein
MGHPKEVDDMTHIAGNTSSGTKAFLDRFERQVDPEGVLPDDVRAATAKHARTAYMLQLAEKVGGGPTA